MNKDVSRNLSIAIGIIVVIIIIVGAWSNLSTTNDIKEDITNKIEDDNYANLYRPDSSAVSGEKNKLDKNMNSFIGTVLEETTTYMVVSPHKDSIERKSADKIRINYGTDHIDYLYGLGRKVVIKYDGNILETYPAQINSNNIYHDGYDDFTLIVKTFDSESMSENSDDRKILNNKSLYKDNSDFDLYYSGVEEVYVKVAGKEMTLKEALVEGYITLNGIVAKANKDFPNAISYDDGGTMEYEYSNYKIKKYHTLEGNRDLWIIAK